MKVLAIILLVCCGLGSSSVQAIECLTAPNRSEAGWWSWREIDGRKCWYKKVGAVPPKLEFTWPEHAKETQPFDPSAQQEPKGIVAIVPWLPQIVVPRVKTVDPMMRVDFRLSEDRVSLIEGFELSGSNGIGATWELPETIPADTFEARYGQW